MSERPAQLVCTVKQGGDVVGYLVIDSFRQGRSHGGIRMREDLDEAEIRLLARTMTRKYRFLNLPFGGAKAGVIGDPEAGAEARLERLTAFGQVIKPILQNELFIPAADMGTNLGEIRAMLAMLDIHFERRRLPDVSSGEYTAHSVFAGFRELARFRGIELAGLNAAIDGFGEVGSHLAVQLEEQGVRVVAVSTSHGAIYKEDGLEVNRLMAMRERYASRLVEHYDGAQPISPRELYRLPVDLLSPCATIHRIDRSNVRGIQAAIICPGANNPWQAGIEREFDRMGISYLPDFAANSGGALGATLAYAGFGGDQIVEFIRTEVGALQRHLLERVEEQGLCIQQAAEAIIDQRDSRELLPRGSSGGSLVGIGLLLHRRGLVPAGLVRPFARRYLRGRIRAGLGY